MDLGVWIKWNLGIKEEEKGKLGYLYFLNFEVLKEKKGF